MPRRYGLATRIRLALHPRGAREDYARHCRGMKILLLGGSNAGLRDGWATQFQSQALAHEVENRFLGAVGSLYGLMALLKIERDGRPPPDVIVFEYCLNDMLLFAAGCQRPRLVEDALAAIAEYCARSGIRLLFLCLEPREAAGRNARKARLLARRLYAAAAARHATGAIWLRDVFPQGVTAALYQDENHLTPEASACVADVALREIEAAKVPASRQNDLLFDYVDATQARRQGACDLRRIETKVFTGPFIRLARPSATFWPGRGNLVGLLLRSDDSSGYYLIRGQGQEFRKNPRSQMQEIVRNLVLLHYVTRTIRIDAEVEIAMPADATALMRLPEDATLLAIPPTAKYEDQTLDIHGVMFWRRRSLIGRIGALLRGRAV